MEGLIHVYTGDGKGKTTAALGLALRAAGWGKRVLIVQFFKGQPSGELLALCNVPSITVLRLGKDHGFFKFMDDAEKSAVRMEHDALLDTVCQSVSAGACDMLILDEVTSAYNCGALNNQVIDELILNKPSSLELVLTGRNAPQSFILAAHYVTQMQSVKHPFDDGLPAREGVEF